MKSRYSLSQRNFYDIVLKDAAKLANHTAMKDILSPLFRHADPRLPEISPNAAPGVGNGSSGTAADTLTTEPHHHVTIGGKLQQISAALSKLKQGKTRHPRNYVPQVNVQTLLSNHVKTGKPFKIHKEFRPPEIGDATNTGSSRKAKLSQLERWSLKAINTSQKNNIARKASTSKPSLLGESTIPNLTDALRDPLAFSRIVANQFGVSADTHHLLNSLLELAPCAPEQQDSSLLRPLLVAHALHSSLAKSGRAAQQALDYLMTTMSLHSLIDADASTDQPETADFLPSAHTNAWRTAEVLARSDQGFETLISIMQNPPPPEQREAMHIFLQASDQLNRSATPTHNNQHFTSGSAPRALREHTMSYPRHVLMQAQQHAGKTGLDSLAAQAVRASASLLMEQLSAVAASDVTRPGLDASAKGVLFAWRQGFREDGKDSDLSMLKSRTHKFIRTAVSRAENRNIRGIFNRMAGRKKTPLASMALGTQGSHLSNIEKEQAAYCKQFQSLSSAMANAVRQASTPPASEEIAHERAMLSALLDHWATQSAPKKISEFILDRASLEGIANSIGLLPASPSDEMTTEQEDGNSLPLQGLIGLPVTLDLLEHLARAADIDTAQPVVAELKKARVIENSDDLRPAAMTREEMTNTLIKLVQSMQQSGRVRFSDGGNTGISTFGISANVSKALHLHGIAIGPRLDLRSEHARSAVLEIGRTTHGYELFLGTVRGKHNQAGGGIRIGYDIDALKLKFRAGGGVSGMLYDKEKSEPRGVIFRVDRETKDSDHDTWSSVKYDDAKMVATMGKLVNFLMDENNSTISTHHDSSVLWDTLAGEFFDDRNLSVGWQTTSAQTSRKRANVDVGINAGIKVHAETTRVGFSVYSELEYASKIRSDLKESGGHIQLEQHRTGKTMRVSAAVGFNASASASASKGKVALGPSSLRPLGAGATILEQGYLAKLTLPQKGDRLLNRACYSDSEYSSANAFVGALTQNRNQWIAMLAKMQGGDQHAGTERINRFISTILANERPGQTYLHRMRLTPEAARDYDRLHAIAVQMRGDTSEEEIRTKQTEILNNTVSWVPHKLAVVDRASTKVTYGIRAGLRVNTISGADGTRELIEEQFR